MDTLLPLVIVFLLVKGGNQDGNATYNEDTGHRTPVLQNTTWMSELSGKDYDASLKIEECPALFCWRLITICDGNCTVDGHICESTLCRGIYQPPNGPTIPTSDACDCRSKCRCYSRVDAYGYVGVTLGYQNILALPSSAFTSISRLGSLRLDNNMITSIHRNTFNGLSVLEFMYLHNNMITSIHNNTFSGLYWLRYLHLHNNMITYIHNNAFNGLHRLLYLGLHNNMMTSIHTNTFSGLSGLAYLDLHNNMITSIHRNTFNGLSGLAILYLHNNSITSLHSNAFNGLYRLSNLHLDNNMIASMHIHTFNGLFRMTYLDLSNSMITSILSNTFSGTSGLKFLYLNDNHINKLHQNIFMNLSKLKSLDLSNNDLTYLSQGLFSNLGRLRKINIMGNPLLVTERMFDGLNNLEQLFTDSYLICCVKPKSIKQVKCAITQNKLCMLWYNTDDCNVARNDQISSCSDLIRSDILRTFLWIFTFCSLFGNVVVMFYRLLIDRDNMMKSYSIFVLNLSVSDFLMGVYMLIIGAVDASFKGKYALNAQFWQRSIWCTTAGVLSTISSEMSTFLVLIVSIDRFIVIVFPLSGRRITWRQAICVSTILWVISITIALIPHFYFKGQFYSQSGVCLALPLTTEHPPGTYYSFSIFIVLNTVIFIVVLLAQIFIFKSLRASSRIASTQTHRRDMAVARTLFFVVATDFCCWVPIGVMGVMARCGVDIPPDIYSWVMIFILPINAAVNPFLYTIAYIWRKRRNAPRPIPLTPIRHPRATPLAIRESPAATPPAVRESPASTPPAVRESPTATPPAVKEFPASTPPAVRESPAVTSPAVRESLAATSPAVRESPAATVPAVRESPAATSPAVRESPEATPPAVRESLAATPLALRESPAATSPAGRESPEATPPAVRESLAPTPLAMREYPEATPPSNREFPVVPLPPDGKMSL